MKTHYQNGESFTVTIQKLRTILGHQNSPNESTVRLLIKKIEKKNGSVQDIKSPGRPRSGRRETNIAVVCDLLL